MTTSNFESITRWKQILDEDAVVIAESKNDPAAFSALYDQYVQPVYRYFYYRTGSAPEAEDLTSQTFLSALEALPRYQHRGNFAAWLFRIARGKVIDYVRRQQKQLPLQETYPAELPDLLAQVVYADEIAHLAALIHRLDEDEQELIRLRYTAGLPFAQIAVILDSNENTIKKSLYRVMARLQSQLEEFHHG
jgi:RNA polymerase sigma-70 factor (ECF subfamily)